MNLNNHNDTILAPRDIRRYPTELELVPGRGAPNNAEGSARTNFSDVAAAVNGAKHSETTAKAPPPAGKNGKPFALWEKDGFGFADFIDIINPLQHIPIVATIYRNFSGDQMGAAPRVIGGALWGRIGGLVTGVANAVVEWWSGKDIGDHIYAAIFSPSKKDPNANAIARNKVTPSSAVLGAVLTHDRPKPPTDRSGAVTSSESPAAVRESDAVDPDALRSDVPPLSSGARNAYEKNRNWGEPDESLARIIDAPRRTRNRV